jgi:two-component system response regulator RegX3
MNAHVLIVEDSPEISQLVALYLERDGLKVSVAVSAEEGLELIRTGIDLVVLDLNLPGIDGFEFLTRLRRNSEIPVIVLSARDQDEDMVLALGIGGDEYVAKPFSPRVLVARCRALLRRKWDTHETVYRSGRIELVVDARKLSIDGRPVGLTNKEFELLKFFLEHRGKTYSSQELFEEVWKNEFGDISSVAVYVQRLRKKIETDPSDPRWLVTIRGSGYLWEQEVVL